MIFGFFWAVGKFWREAPTLCLCVCVSVGCKDSSGLVGFDYDGLHFSPPLAPPRDIILDCAKLPRFSKVKEKEWKVKEKCRTVNEKL